MVKVAKKESTMAEDQREIPFGVAGVAKMSHSASIKYRIPETHTQKLEIIRAVLIDGAIVPETPFAHIVDCDRDLEAGADSCKRAGGGWFTDLTFWWNLTYPAEVQRHAKLPNNKFGDYISINVFEMLCVVINFAASIHFCHIDGLDLDSFFVLVNWCDNTSACSWVNWKCKNSFIGRALGRFFKDC